MADLKISELTNLTAADPANDMIPIVDVSATPPASGSTKRISINNILACSPSATLASATISGNLTVDTSTLKVDSTANRVGVLTASPESELDVRGLIAVRGTPTFPTTGVGPELFWSPGNSNSNLYSYNRGTSAWAEMAYGALIHVFQISGSEAMRLNATGNLVLKGGTAGANGVGITFPTTQVASSDANCLDDYEEGTFTPAISGTSVAGAGTYSNQIGRYTKVGNQVTVWIRLSWSAHTGSGDMTITGLPFTLANVNNLGAGAAIGYSANISLTAGNYLMVYGDAGNSRAYLWQTPTGGGSTNTVSMDSSGDLGFTMTYIV